MNLYDKARRAVKPENPGRLLYKAWWNTLDLYGEIRSGPYNPDQHSGTMNLGLANWSVSVDPDVSEYLDGRPNLRLHWYGGIFFEVRANGWFRIPRLHGQKQRSGIARHTFLRSSHFRDYNWFVDLDGWSCSYENHWWSAESMLSQWRTVTNPLAPRRYVSEATMGCRNWRYSTWYKLQRDEFHATPSDNGWHITLADSDLVRRDHFERFERLRIQRYIELDRAYRTYTGELPSLPLGAPESTEELLRVRSEFTTAIITGFSFDTLARTTPLRTARPEQEEVLWELDGSR